MGAALLSVAEKSFRHAEAFFRASKSSEKWGSSSCRTPFPGFPHTPFRPVDESVPLFWQVQGGPEHMLRSFLSFRLFFHRRRSLSDHSTTGRLFTTAAQRGQRSS